MRVLTGGKINPLIGAAGTSAFPMSSRVVQKEGQKEEIRSVKISNIPGGFL
jgi:oxaloacetate decarboxylase beta subunit